MKKKLNYELLRKHQQTDEFELYTIKNFELDLGEFIEVKKSQNLAPRTLTDYELHANNFIRYIQKSYGGDTELNIKAIQNYTLYMLHTRNLKPASVNVALRCLRTYCNWLYIGKKIEKLEIKTIKGEDKRIRIATPSRFKRLLKVIKADSEHPAEYRDYILLNLLHQTGMRIGECLSIRISDINLNRRSILLRASETKARRERVVFFRDTLKPSLKSLIEVAKFNNIEWLFYNQYGERMLPQSIMSKVRTYNNRAYFNKEDRITCHILRHTFATEFLANGGDIHVLQRLLGHTTLHITQRYLHLSDTDLRKHYDATK